INQTGIYSTPSATSPTIMPGGRSNGITWTDAVGTLWLFGGEGYPATGTTVGELNDLWRYTISNNSWTWERGSSINNQVGSYGSIGIPAFTNIPGARRASVCWSDQLSNLWFFGGFGQPGSAGTGKLNDLWKYNNCFISPITMTITSGDSVICARETTSLTATGSLNYSWSGTTATTPYLVITPTITTTYSVFAVDNNGCTYMSAFTETVFACTSVNETLSDNLNYSLFPNPNSGTFNLNLENQTNAVNFIIINALGQKVFEE